MACAPLSSAPPPSAQVTKEAAAAAAAVGSMGVALTSCSLPGKPASLISVRARFAG